MWVSSYTFRRYTYSSSLKHSQLILTFSSQRQIPLTRVLYVGSRWGQERHRVLRRVKGRVCVGSLFCEILLPAASHNQRVLDVKLPTVSFFAQPFTCCRHVTTQLQKKENGCEGDYGPIIEPFQMTSCLPYCLPCIDVKFIFDSVRLGLSSPANILQIADVALWVVFLLFLLCF